MKLLTFKLGAFILIAKGSWNKNAYVNDINCICPSDEPKQNFYAGTKFGHSKPTSGN